MKLAFCHRSVIFAISAEHKTQRSDEICIATLQWKFDAKLCAGNSALCCYGLTAYVVEIFLLSPTCTSKLAMLVSTAQLVSLLLSDVNAYQSLSIREGEWPKPAYEVLPMPK